MSETYDQSAGNEDLWRTIFRDGHPELLKQHRFYRRLPRDPRCRLCLAPFAGLGGAYMRFRGKRPNSRNRHYCNACDAFLEAFPGGAEVAMSVLFVDVRGSVDAAKDARPSEVSARINRFLDDATEIITRHSGFVMAFYGDCVVAAWPPGFVGPDHAAQAVAAARDLSARFRAGQDDIEAGVGVHTGEIFIGTVQAAQGLFRDVSVFGENVNFAARLSGAAGPGEALISLDAAEAAGIAASPDREVSLKGWDRPVAVVAV